MKTKLKKAKCFFLLIAILLFCSGWVYALENNDSHTHSDNCIYSCELDEIETTSYTPIHEHIDHEGSENCKYSCTHDINNYTEYSCSSRDVWSEEKVQAFIEDSKNLSSDEERIAFISKYYDIPEDEIDLAEMRANAEIVRAEAAEGKYIQAWNEALADYINCTGADIEIEQFCK